MGMTAPAVKVALVTLWQAALGSTVQVGASQRVNFTLAERVTLGDVAGSYEPITLGTNRQMEENYEIEGKVSVSSNGPPEQQPVVTARAYAILDAIDVATRSVGSENAGLGAQGVIWAYVAGDVRLTEAPESDTGGPLNATVDFRVRVRARNRLF